MLVAAVVAVVALTGLPNNDGRIDRALMPDITEQPAVGNPIDSRDVLDGDFQITKFSLFGLLDHDTGLVLGYTYSDGRWSDSYDATYAAGRQEGERHVAIGAPEGAYDKLCFGDFSHGYTEGGVDYYSEVWCDGYRDGYEGTADRLLEMLSGASAALAAFDFETGETKWQLNLLEAADIDAEDWLSILLDWTEASQDIFSGLVGEPMAVPDGRGNALVVIGGHIMTVDGGGTVVSTAEFDGSYVECSQGFVVITTRGGADVEAYRTTDLETELWSADAPDTALRMGGPVVVHEPSSTFWAPTADGFVDVPTGEGIGFGDDLDKANYYAVPLRPDLVVLRGDLGKDRLARIDPKNGEEMWRANNVSPYLPQMTSDYILLEDNSGGGTARIIAIDIADGEEAWVANTGAIAAVSEDRVLSKVDQEGKHELVAFNATKGTELYRVKIDEFANPQMGRRVLYHTPDMVSGAVDGVTRVQAVSLQDGKVLWEVSADGMPPYSVGLLYGGQGRAWLLSPDSSDGGQSASVFSAATWEMMVPLRQ
ncbi:MAG: PQQ-like beta-propeller repeat protein [Bifidobacteriaceae bacterium]|nr:PQQ-like beta-propeller repeat protein [Bifidobacteriaceae bacterium]